MSCKAIAKLTPEERVSWRSIRKSTECLRINPFRKLVLELWLRHSWGLRTVRLSLSPVVHCYKSRQVGYPLPLEVSVSCLEPGVPHMQTPYPSCKETVLISVPLPKPGILYGDKLSLIISPYSHLSDNV